MKLSAYLVILVMSFVWNVRSSYGLNFTPPTGGKLVWGCEGQHSIAETEDEWFTTIIDPAYTHPGQGNGLGFSMPHMNQPDCDELPENPFGGSSITGGIIVENNKTEEEGQCRDIPKPEGSALCVYTSIWFQDANASILLGVSKNWYTSKLSKQKVRVRFRGLNISLTTYLRH